MTLGFIGLGVRILGTETNDIGRNAQAGKSLPPAITFKLLRNNRNN
jgi:hypothetical protein